MTLKEFYTEQQLKLNDFYDEWIKNNKKYPEEYPMELDPGEWDEYFEMYNY